MVTCMLGEVNLLGQGDTIGIDFLAIMDSVNSMKKEDKNSYDMVVNKMKTLIETDEEVKECVIEFIENLHDIL